METIQNSKLISILSALDQTDWRYFRNFLISNLGGPTGKSFEVFRVLSEYYPDFSSQKLTKVALFAAVFPGEEYEDKKLRYAMTDLYRQACNFLTIRGLANHPDIAGSLLQEQLAKREADKAYLSHYRSNETTPIADQPKDADYFHSMFRDTYTNMSFFMPRQKRTGHNPGGDAAEYLDRYYIARKLQLLCELINAKNVMSTNYDFFLQDEIIAALRKGAFADIPVISIYFHILLTLTEPEEESHFFSLRKLLYEQTTGLKKEDVFDMFQYLQNYCIRKINLGNTAYVNTLFEIYQILLERKIIYKDSVLSQYDFKNIVAIGIRAGDFDWVYRFIETGKNDLAENEQTNAYIYNLAYYHFGIGNYKKAISNLQQVEFTDLYYQLDTRAILLKCYYELNDEETLLYHLAAFRIFLSRNKLISDYQRTIYRNLVKCTTKLVRLGNHPKKREQLLNEINEIKQIADINWLRRKIIELN